MQTLPFYWSFVTGCEYAVISLDILKILHFFTLQFRLEAKCICRPTDGLEYHIFQHRSSHNCLVYFRISTILNFFPVLYSLIVACLLFSPIKIASGQSSWLQNPEVRVRFPAVPDFFWEVVGLERGPLSLVMITEELFQGNSGSGLENRN
jgi:hypothetical protein